jgi:hypothetical protein
MWFQCIGLDIFYSVAVNKTRRWNGLSTNSATSKENKQFYWEKLATLYYIFFLLGLLCSQCRPIIARAWLLFILSIILLYFARLTLERSNNEMNSLEFKFSLMTFSENFSFCYTQMKENKVKLFLLSSLTLQHRLLPYKRKGYSILANRITRWSITNSILLSYFFNCAQKKIFNKRTFVSLLFLSRLFISSIIKRNDHKTTENIFIQPD